MRWFGNFFLIAFWTFRQTTFPLEVADQNNFAELYNLNMQSQIFCVFHLQLRNEEEGVKLGLILVSLETHTQFPNACLLKLFRYLEGFSHRST